MNDLFKQLANAKIECLHRGMVIRPTVEELYQAFKERLVKEISVTSDELLNDAWLTNRKGRCQKIMEKMRG